MEDTANPSSISQLAAAVAGIAARADALVGGQDVVDLLAEVEQLGHMVDAAKADVLAVVDKRGLYRVDGHGSAKVQVRHVTKISPAKAAVRAKTVRMCRALPEVADSWRRGSLGTDQVELLARVHANPRVRNEMADYQAWFLSQAARLSFSDFRQLVLQWERLVDDDGAEPNQRNHDARNARMRQHLDLSWELIATYAALQGAAMEEILAAYIRAELLADWEKARAEFGDAATAADLPRTEQQRRADALYRLFCDAASADGSAVPPGFTHSIVWDEATYAEMLRRLDGEASEPLDPTTTVCRTGDGAPLDPTEAAANSLLYAVLRVVVDADSVVIDQGRARCFTGNARHAVKLGFTTCMWPGCCAPVSVCEVDHLTDHANGGPTNPRNGGPLCGRHNRWKQKGFTITRDPGGDFVFRRPDGTKLE